jgi:hypothetical protein
MLSIKRTNCLIVTVEKRHKRIYTYIQGVLGGQDKIRESVLYVKVYRYNPKHLCPKLNGYGDNGQRKVW